MTIGNGAFGTSQHRLAWGMGFRSALKIGQMSFSSDFNVIVTAIDFLSAGNGRDATL